MLLSFGLTAQAATEKKTGNELIVGVPVDRPPMFYPDEDTGEETGIGVDLMRAAAEAAGYSPTFRIISEKNLKEALDNEEYDVLMPFGSPIKSASGKDSIVSENLTQTPFTLVTVSRHKLPEMNELRVGMLSSLSGGADTVRTLYPGMQIRMYDTMPECVSALRKGNVDALLHNSYVWSYVLQKPSYHDLAVQPSAMFSMDFRAGALDTTKGRAIMEQLNKGIATLTETRVQAVTLDHTSRRLYHNDLSDFLYEYGVVLVLSILLFLALIVVITYRMRVIRMEQEEKMRRMIDHDLLTGALSMNGFRKRAEELLRAHPDIPYIISYNNIKDFKYINDRLGRAAGDELLKFWVKRSMDNLTEVDALGRIESDHFALLRRIIDQDQMIRDEEHIFKPLTNYFIDRGKAIKVRMCSGIYVVTPEDHQNIDIDRMLDFARVAEERMRANKVDGFELYNPQQWAKGRRSSDIVSRLPIALELKEIQVWYQPQVNYMTGEISGAEALCRWNHGQLGWISPGEFIPALENAGQIYELDRYVWETVCSDLRRWKKEGNYRTVSVNISRNDIQANNDLPEYFLDLVRKYDLTPDQLCVEITETAYVEETDTLLRTTTKFRKFGFKVEMDDFGSGYSSLNMMKKVPVDRIKLDLNFQDKSGDPEMGQTIIKHVIEMIHELGMGVVAEGIETEGQAQFMKNLGCAMMQGYYFYKPMPVDELEKLLASQK